VTIAEVGELVPTGDLDAESIHTPHLYVDELVLSQ
jgi:acyl CoA:acetate/3-ketoacid CoA transferase alpha subunit